MLQSSDNDLINLPKLNDIIVLSKQINKIRISKNRLYMLDFDGTLTSFVKYAPEAMPTKLLLKILDKLTSDSKNKVYINSGRDLIFLKEQFKNVSNIGFVIEHGNAIIKPDEKKLLSNKLKLDFNWFGESVEIVKVAKQKLPQSYFEVKGYGVSFLTRPCDRYSTEDISNIEAVEKEVKAGFERIISRSNGGLRLQSGIMVLEITQSGRNKGDSLREISNGCDYDIIITAGDDSTDASMLEVAKNLNSQNICIGVGEKYTFKEIPETENVKNSANVFAQSPIIVLKFLAKAAGLEELTDGDIKDLAFEQEKFNLKGQWEAKQV